MESMRKKIALAVRSRRSSRPRYSSCVGMVTGSRKARAGSLTMREREEISRGLCAGESYRTIAGFLGRAVSTISREQERWT